MTARRSLQVQNTVTVVIAARAEHLSLGRWFELWSLSGAHGPHGYYAKVILPRAGIGHPESEAAFLDAVEELRRDCAAKFGVPLESIPTYAEAM